MRTIEIKNRLEDGEPYFHVHHSKAPTSEFFETARSEDVEGWFSHFNVEDIDKANRLFQALKKQAANKLLQRLRKLKYESARRNTNNQKIGIELERSAHTAITRFVEQFGFKTLSIAVIVMDKMANKYFSGDVNVALEELYKDKLLDPLDVFVSNDVTKQVVNWLADGNVYYSEKTFRYYLSSDSEYKGDVENCYELAHNYRSIIIQMFNTRRAFVTGDLKTSNLTGRFVDNEVVKLGQKEEVSLKPVVNLHTLFGGADAYTAYVAVMKLMKKWDILDYQQQKLLGFNPREMNIEDPNDLQLRLSLLLNIHAELRNLFDNNKNVYGFMTMANHNAPFNGSEPIDLACSDIEGLKAVYSALQSLRDPQGASVAEAEDETISGLVEFRGRFTDLQNRDEGNSDKS